MTRVRRAEPGVDGRTLECLGGSVVCYGDRENGEHCLRVAGIRDTRLGREDGKHGGRRTEWRSWNAM